MRAALRRVAATRRGAALRLVLLVRVADLAGRVIPSPRSSASRRPAQRLQIRHQLALRPAVPDAVLGLVDGRAPRRPRQPVLRPDRACRRCRRRSGRRCRCRSQLMVYAMILTLLIARAARRPRRVQVGYGPRQDDQHDGVRRRSRCPTSALATDPVVLGRGEAALAAVAGLRASLRRPRRPLQDRWRCPRSASRWGRSPRTCGCCAAT